MNIIKKYSTVPAFPALLAAQALSALNDNLFRFALVSAAVFSNTLSPTHAQIISTIAPLIFLLPYILFAKAAGTKAQTTPPAGLLQTIRLWEIPVWCAVALFLSIHNPVILLLLLFITGIFATYYSPVKYLLVPLLSPPPHLNRGNSLMESSVLLAIVVGSILGTAYGASIAFLCVILAIISYLLSRFVRVPTIHVSSSPSRGTALVPDISAHNLKWRDLEQKAQNAIYARAVFWAIGAGVMGALAPYARQHFYGDANMASLLLTVFSVGIGLGGFIIQRFVFVTPSHYRLFCLLGLAVSLSLIALIGFLGGNWPQLPLWYQLVVILPFLCLALVGGAYLIPHMAIIQTAIPPEQRGHWLAASNRYNAYVMIGTSALLALASMAGIAPAGLFLGLAVAIILFTVWMAFFWGRHP